MIFFIKPTLGKLRSGCFFLQNGGLGVPGKDNYNITQKSITISECEY